MESREPNGEFIKIIDRDPELVSAAQARRASSIDPRQLKLIGELMNTLNVDKTLSVKWGEENTTEGFNIIYL
jgi:hypothetical protein